MITLLALAFLAVTASADNTVTIGCGQCSNSLGLCYNLNGGPFSNVQVAHPNQNNQFCQFNTAEYKFRCDRGNCQGCEITMTRRGGLGGDVGPVSECSDTANGRSAISFLDNLHNSYKGNNLNERYDWCDCDGLSGGQIAGIVIGSVAAAILLGLLAWWCLKKRKSSSQQSHHQQNHQEMVMHPSPSERAVVTEVNKGSTNQYGGVYNNQNGVQGSTYYGGYTQNATPVYQQQTHVVQGSAIPVEKTVVTEVQRVPVSNQYNGVYSTQNGVYSTQNGVQSSTPYVVYPTETRLN